MMMMIVATSNYDESDSCYIVLPLFGHRPNKLFIKGD